MQRVFLILIKSVTEAFLIAILLKDLCISPVSSSCFQIACTNIICFEKCVSWGLALILSILINGVRRYLCNNLLPAYEHVRFTMLNQPFADSLTGPIISRLS